MKIFLQCLLIYIFIWGSNSDDVSLRCNPLKVFVNSLLNFDASESETGQDVIMLEEVMDTSRDKCLETCCDLIEDGCTVAVFSETDAECTLYKCSPVDRCVVISYANTTTTFIGLASTPSADSGLLTDSSQVTTTTLSSKTTDATKPSTTDHDTKTTSTASGLSTNSTQVTTTTLLSQTTDATKLSTTNQDARTTSTPGKVIQSLTYSTSSSTESPAETITTEKQGLVEVAQKTNSTVAPVSTNANQLKESLNDMPKDLPLQQELKTSAADVKSLEKSFHSSSTMEVKATQDDPRQTSSTIGSSTRTTVSKTDTPESQTPPPTRSTLNVLSTDSATSSFSVESTTAVSKTEEGVRTKQATETTEGTTGTISVSEIITHKVSTESSINSINTEASEEKETNNESNALTSPISSTFLTHTSTPFTKTTSTTTGDTNEHTTVTTSSQKIQTSSLFLTNLTDNVSETTQLQSVTTSVTKTASTTSTSGNAVTTQSNETKLIDISEQGADQFKRNNTLPIEDLSKDLFVSGALISALSFGVLVFFAMVVIVGRRCFEGWKRRQYSRIDYLVNGMYN